MTIFPVSTQFPQRLFPISEFLICNFKYDHGTTVEHHIDKLQKQQESKTIIKTIGVFFLTVATSQKNYHTGIVF